MSDFTDNYTYSVETDFKSNRTFTALEWRTEPPTEPGWYWAKWYMGDDPLHMVEIVVEAGRFYVSGEYMCPIDDGSYTHWLGPLPVPEMPK